MQNHRWNGYVHVGVAAKTGHLGQFGLWENDVAEAKASIETFDFHWVVWRLEADCVLGMSLDFADVNNWVRVSNVSENSLPGRKNRITREIPELSDQDMRPGDFVEIVNGKRSHT